jgi:Mrp family chromosome partitioning ATPase
MSVMRLVGGIGAEAAPEGGTEARPDARMTRADRAGSNGGSGEEAGRGRSTAVSVFRFQRQGPPVPAPRQRGADAGGRGPAGDRGPAGETDARDPLRATLVRRRNDPDRSWDALNPIRPEAQLADRNRLILAHDGDPAGAAFDLLRTQIVQAAAGHGWRRIAVTAPTSGCGKGLVLANLALALARRPGYRTVVIDLDLRAPSLAARFGVEDAGPLAEVLLGEQPIEAMFHRIGHALALGLNDRRETASAEILQDPRTAETLEAIELALAPDLMLFGLPPLLGLDDVLGFLPRVDGVLLVADGTRTLARDIAEAERLLRDRTTLVGVVLNRAEGDGPGR